MSRLRAGARVGDKEQGASCSDILFDRSFHQYRYIASDIAILISNNKRSMAFDKDKKSYKITTGTRQHQRPSRFVNTPGVANGTGALDF